jgi:two-component system response regulator GlrR
MIQGMAKGREPERTASLSHQEAPEHALVRSFRLEVVDQPGNRFASRGERTVIGTHRSADMVLDDSTVSRFHCEIRIEDGRAVVRDLDSRNGTRVDGVLVWRAQLEDQAVLTIGRTKIRFELGPEDVKVPLSPRQSFGLLVGNSLAMRGVFAQLEQSARSDLTVLLQGETGTGKDAAAESIHREGKRGNGPFVVVDCGAITSTLIESELFGHVRGAFTGADRDRAGAFELADGGTLFLDEIGELDLELQPKFLRVLEQREVQRVGDPRPIPIDVRVIAATNRNLRGEVNAGRFRSDLFYRLAVFEVRLPALRERKEDLPLLVGHFLDSLRAADHPLAGELRGMKFLSSLVRHPWPGNVRELRNYLERCLAVEEQLPLRAASGLPVDDESAPAIDVRAPLKLARERMIRWFEREYLRQILAAHEGNVSAAARAAGIDRAHIYRLLFRSGLR